MPSPGDGSLALISGDPMKKTKKLVLAKETLRRLEAARDLEQVAGGGTYVPRDTNAPSVYWSCEPGGSYCAC